MSACQLRGRSRIYLARPAWSVHHLVAMVREFEMLGVGLIVLGQAIKELCPPQVVGPHGPAHPAPRRRARTPFAVVESP